MLCVVQLAFGCQCDLYLKYLFYHKGKFKLMEEPLLQPQVWILIFACDIAL